ncbi:MAG: GNAT family N-acetyltransferase [Henriciella sp.]|uniref:GNAT family N-acetyltransferase n=1 Tax=Henriciella sp. TaxID=1968823 RepID=UPI00260BFF76|nr:GNAT family N-acetyltransferase [Henriciella sp.]
MSHRAAGWKIRLRMQSDNSGIETVFRDCLTAFPWRGQQTEEIIRLRHAISLSDCLVAHELSAGLIGFLVLERKKAYVSHLFVNPDWRLCGVGSGLLGVARDMARAPLQLDVDTQNETAVRAYKAMGWIEKVGPDPNRAGQRRLSGP